MKPEAAFGQLRVKARSASRKVAAVAREVVQDAQRQRLAAWALQDVRVRAAEARARDAEQALQAAQAELAHRIAALDQAQIRADDRDRAADDRDRIADERDRMAGERDRAADHQEWSSCPQMVHFRQLICDSAEPLGQPK